MILHPHRDGRQSGMKRKQTTRDHYQRILVDFKTFLLRVARDEDATNYKNAFPDTLVLPPLRGELH